MSLKYAVSTRLPTPFAIFDIHGFRDFDTGKEHVAVTLGDIRSGEPVLCRVHSECLTGDALFSQRCDCGSQLNAALKLIAEEGRGILLYLRQEGRGIGLINKLRAYKLQDEGADTVEANERLGFGADMRNYLVGAQMLGHFGIESVRLMTNNPRKVAALARDGITIAKRVPLQSNLNPCNTHYLQTKAIKLGHMLSHLKLQ
uniref:GTP cyclohydrolase-2 n=1 Tax=Pseudomonas putida TaxID=303 RepID=M4YSK2_PSEPU|nr:GTP cyclohydrolase II [Pseudomonas putida]